MILHLYVLHALWYQNDPKTQKCMRPIEWYYTYIQLVAESVFMFNDKSSSSSLLYSDQHNNKEQQLKENGAQSMHEITYPLQTG